MGRITEKELSPDLVALIGTGSGDSNTLAGKPAEYYDQNEHVYDNSIHVTQELKDTIDNMMSSQGAQDLKQEAVTESNTYTDTKLGELVTVSPEMYNQLAKVTQLLLDNPDTLASLMAAIADKLEISVFDNHLSAKNPHKLKPEDLGLGNVDNVADKDKIVLGAKTLEMERYIRYTGDVTGQVAFDGSKDVECVLTYAGEDVNAEEGEYTKVYVDSKGRVLRGSNPQTLAGYGIIDAATKDQGAKADTAIQEIYVGMWGKVTVIEGTAFLPDYPTNAETLGGKEPSYYAVNRPASIDADGIMTSDMYLRLFGSPTELDVVNMYKEDPDENGIYKTIKYYINTQGEDGTFTEHLYKVSRLTGDAPNYPFREDYVFLNGSTIKTVYTLSYDANGTVISEVVNSRNVTVSEE